MLPAGKLGAWFAGPILSTASPRPDESRLASTLLGKADSWPDEWPRVGRSPLGDTEPVDPGRWLSFQRTVSKGSWLSRGPGKPPWPLVAKAPAIVSFLSFKGGVGRSTALGMIAWQLARKGRKVVCVDLDLEAPGLAALMGAPEEPSVLDFLLTTLATGRSPQEDPVHSVTVQG